MSRSLVLNARALIGIYALLLVWSLVNIIRGPSEDILSLVFFSAAVCSVWGAYRGQPWAVLALFLTTVLSVLGSIIALLNAAELWSFAKSSGGSEVRMFATFAIWGFQVAVWFQFKSYWNSLTPKPPAGTRLKRESRAPWDLL